MNNLWKSTARGQFKSDPLTSVREVEVAIVGGGYTGCSVALHVAQAGQSVAVVEAKKVGAGCSGSNSGNMNPGLWLRPDQINDRLGPVYGARLNAFLRDGPSQVASIVDFHQIDCQLNRAGTLHCAWNQKGRKELEQRLDGLRDQGFNASILEKTDTRERLGGDYYDSCLWNRDAGSIQPYAYLIGLAQAATTAGASIYEDSPAVDVERLTSGWIVRTPQGNLRCRWLVIATDAYHQSLSFGATNNMSRIWYFNFATAPLGSGFDHILPGRQGCWDTGYLMTSFTRDDDGRFVIGSVGQLGRGSRGINQSWARRRLVQLFPELSETPFEYSWHGSMGMTPDGLPRVTNLGENAIGIFGYSGRGIAPATLFGRAIAEYIKTKDPECLPLPLTPPADTALRAFREAYYGLGSTLYHLVSRNHPGKRDAA